MADSKEHHETGSFKLTSARVLGALMVIGFLITLVILITDDNLKNDFGLYTGSGYFIHWYGLLVTGIIDIIAAIILFLRPSRFCLALGFAWSIVMIAFLFGDTLLYSQVGFSTMSQFEDYLFGLSKLAGSESYYPGLYDVLIGLYVVSLIYSGIALIMHRKGKVA